MHDTLDPTKDPADGQTRACLDRLRRLPQEMEPPYNWQGFQRRARERVSESRHRTSPWYLAAAAALLAVVCGIALWGRNGGGTRPQLTEPPSLADGASRRPRESQLTGRAQDSSAIESWLATLPPEPIVVHVGTRAAVTRLEDRIAQVDDLLTAERLDGVRPDRVAALQRERTRLVGSLAQVRYAEVVASEVP